jgi:hypothetical protein
LRDGAFCTAAQAQDVDWKKVDEMLGRTAAVGGDVHRYGFPRTDLNVTLDGVAIKPGLALGGWAAFKPMHGEVMVMGDLVRLDSEITALAESKTPLTAAPAGGTPPAIDLDTAQLDSIMGVKGTNNGGVYAFGVPRRDPISEGGMAITPVGPMGLANGINFQPTGGGKAAITGDFLVTGDEVNPLIRTLRQNGIEVTAIHSHMLDEQPRMIFIHFWANDDAIKLAKGIRAALEKTAIAKS